MAARSMVIVTGVSNVSLSNVSSVMWPIMQAAVGIRPFVWVAPSVLPV